MPLTLLIGLSFSFQNFRTGKNVQRGRQGTTSMQEMLIKRLEKEWHNSNAEKSIVF